MVVKDSVNWYESHLSPVERKSRGHFSTPPALVESILDACGFTVEQLLARFRSESPRLNALRVLDPACGGGNFLSAVAQRLITAGKQANLYEKQIHTLVQNGVWGFDPDPVACFLAEMQIRNTLATYASTPERFHIHQADGLAFPWQEQHEQVDLFLANPPYLAAKNNDLSVYRSTEGRGQVDSYLLFLDLALRVVRPGGWIGLVLPDAVLARVNATRERRRLLDETTIHALWHLSNVFPAYVGAVVLVAQKNPPSHLHSVSWRREKWYKSEKLRQERQQRHARPLVAPCVPQSLLRAQPHAEMRYLLGGDQQTVIARLQAYMHSMPTRMEQSSIQSLETLVSVKRGEELSKASHFVKEASSTETQFPLLRGGVDVQAYATPQASNWLSREVIVKPLERYLVPKLLVVKSTPRLQATLDVQCHVVLQTLYMLNCSGVATRDGRKRKVMNVAHQGVINQGVINQGVMNQTPTDGEGEIDVLYYLLALLNSDLLRNYVYVLHTAYKWVQPQIEQHVLECLPIPALDTPYYTEIVQRAKEIMVACDREKGVVKLSDHIQQLYTEQERTIVAMYQDALDRSVNKGVS